MRFVLIALLLSAGTANAEVWECQTGSYWDDQGKIVVVAATGPGDGYGSIQVAGTTHLTMYKVAGFNRRWDWSDGDGNAESEASSSWYMFTIELNGAGYYVNFGGGDEKKRKQAEQVFVCKQRS